MAGLDSGVWKAHAAHGALRPPIPPRRNGESRRASAPRLHPLCLEHRSAASRRAAAARHCLACTLAQAAVVNQPIVVAKLLTGSNRPLGVDEHAKSGVLERLAIRRATVIDVLRRVAAPAGVDDAPVAHLEQQRMERVRSIAVRPSACFVVRRACPAIFDDAGTLSNRPRCKCAAPVRGRQAYDAWWLSVGIGHGAKVVEGGCSSDAGRIEELDEIRTDHDLEYDRIAAVAHAIGEPPHRALADAPGHVFP